MRIVESLSDVVTVKPAAQEILENIVNAKTYHETYKVRHPLAAYNTSLAAVSDKVIKVLDVLEKVQKEREFEVEKNSDWESELIDATDHMLDSIMEHLEDCVGVIRSFFPESKSGDFKSAKKVFSKSISGYRDHIGKIVNYLKHNQGRLRVISFSWSNGSSLGYFVEGPVAGGGLGPVSVVHRDEASAFSYYRDVPFHLCNMYAVSRRLAVVIRGINKGRMRSGKPLEKGKPTKLARALERASKLPRIYFDDEVKKGVPDIRFGSKRVKIDCPNKKVRAHAVPGGARVRVSFRGDGYTRSYVMPYFKRQN